MAKVGKPPWIPPPPEEVEKLASTGLTMEQIASCLGIHVSTLCDKRHQYTEFDQAIKRGRDKGIRAVANALFENAMNGNTVAQIFFLKARADWNDKPVETPQKTPHTEYLENLNKLG